VHPGIRDSFGHYIRGRDDGSPEPVPRRRPPAAGPNDRARLRQM